MSEKQPYILWLPSWYPNRLEPYNGDFIQRHAKAASLYANIVVIFFTQYGEKVHTCFSTEIREDTNLKEIIVYVPFKPTGINFIDKVLYNIKFYTFSRKYLRRFLKQVGLPKLVHVHVPVKAGNLGIWIRKDYNIPYVVSEHSSTYLKEAPDNFFRRSWLYRTQVRRIFSRAVSVTNVSAAIGQILISLFQIKNIRTIHNTVDVNLFYYSPEKQELFTYLHASSLSEQKNILGMLRAFKCLYEIRKDWRLLLVGPYNNDIKDFIINNGLQEVIMLTGEVAYRKVAHYMRRSDVFVLFSLHENFPCVIVEALCCGLPVITSDVAGIKEAVNALNGILVESQNEEALFNALLLIRKTINKYDPKRISADAEKKFSYNAIGNQFAELYRSVGLEKDIN